MLAPVARQVNTYTFNETIMIDGASGTFTEFTGKQMYVDQPSSLTPLLGTYLRKKRADIAEIPPLSVTFTYIITCVSG